MSDPCRICHQPHAPNEAHKWPGPMIEGPVVAVIEAHLAAKAAPASSDTFDPHCPCCVEAKRQRDEKMAKMRAARGKKNA